jgi:hypothetical protein
LKVILSTAVLSLSLISFYISPSFADPTPTDAPASPVTQEQFKAWTDWAKKSVEILNQREKRVEAEEASLKSQQANQPANPAAPSSDGAVDLSTLGAAPGGGSGPAGSGGASQMNLGDMTSGGSSHSGPKLTTYFDFNIVNQPGTQDALAFDNYHSFVFFDIAPTPDLTFSFNMLGPQIFPLYYELDYQASKRLTLRAGKIWIPFDDLSQVTPHNIFGGRNGITQLEPTATGNDGQTFLPYVWTDLGVGAKFMLVDESDVQLETHLCIVNGFTDGGQDPVTTSSSDYPFFTTYSPVGTSNQGDQSGFHRDKSIVTRAHVLVDNAFGLGVSYYTGQWNKDSDPAGHLRLNMVGVDAQAKLLGIELRGGLASMNVQLPGTSTRRGGTYAEIGVPFAGRKWKVLARGGTLQLDSRISEPTDQTIIGGTILYNPGMVQFSIEHSRDIKNPGVAVGFVSYTDLRMVMLF